MEILTAPTPGPLERALLARIDALQSDDPFRTLLVVAPTGRLLVRLRRLILAGGKTRWGVHLLHHRALAEKIVEGAGGVPVSVLRSRDQRALLSALLATIRSPGPLARAALARRGCLAALHATLRDLRDAAVDPAAASETLMSEQGREVAAIHAAYGAALDRLAAEEGRGDAASLDRQAGEAAGGSALLAPPAVLLHTGAYDLTGIHRDLIARVAKRIPAVLFVPGVSSGPAFAHAREALERWVGRDAVDKAESLEGEGAFAGRIDALSDEGAGAMPGGEASRLARRVEVFSATGNEAELETAARRALALHAAGVPLSEIAIVARSLEPYAPFLEAVLGRDHGLPFVTSTRAPLARDPGVRALRDLVRCLTEDFPARSLIDFVRSPASRLELLLPEEATAQPDRWDRLARRHGIVEGYEAWTEDLPEAARERLEERRRDDASLSKEDRGRRIESARGDLESCRSLGRLVEALGARREQWVACRGWEDHAAFLASLAGEGLRPPKSLTGGAARRTLMSVVRGLAVRAGLMRAAGVNPRGAVTPEEACAVLFEGIEGESLPMAPSMAPGLAVLDMMQARGLPFHTVFWLGLNADLIPRRIRPDPVLPDGDRQLLRERTGAPLPVAGEGIAEERLLVAMTLGAAGERVVLSWQRADESGRGRAPSIVVRELARALTGRPAVRELFGAPAGRVRVIPLDPSARALREADGKTGGSGLVPFRDAAAALASRRPDPASALAALPRAGERREAPGAGAVEHAAALARFDPSDLSRDGLAGRSVLPDRWSPTSLEMMGRCPARFFFRHGLKVYDIDRPGPGYQVEPVEIGRHVHRVLERLLAGLLDDDGRPAVGRSRAGELAERIRKDVETLFDDETAALARRVGRRFPALWEGIRDRWVATIVRAAHRDIRRLLEEGSRVVAIEQTIEADLPVGGISLPALGRVDRLDALEDGRLRVVDYKTGRFSLELMVKPVNALRGTRLQLALYRLLVATAREGAPEIPMISAEVLPVAPEIDLPDDEGFERFTFHPESNDRIDGERYRRGLEHTLVVLAGMAAKGRFPLRDGSTCFYCEYDPACRRAHPPSEHRATVAVDYAPYFDLDRKKLKSPGPPDEGGTR